VKRSFWNQTKSFTPSLIDKTHLLTPLLLSLKLFALIQHNASASNFININKYWASV